MESRTVRSVGEWPQHSMVDRRLVDLEGAIVGALYSSEFSLMYTLKIERVGAID
jgi:hypothetical protein